MIIIAFACMTIILMFIHNDLVNIEKSLDEIAEHTSKEYKL